MTGKFDSLYRLISKSKRHRSSFVASQMRRSIARQIRVLRKQRKKKQTDMEREFGIKQSWVSQLENPNSKGLMNIRTLLQLADAFDVGLLIRFVPYETFIHFAARNTEEDLMIEPFATDLEGSSSQDTIGEEVEEGAHESVLTGKRQVIPMAEFLTDDQSDTDPARRPAHAE